METYWASVTPDLSVLGKDAPHAARVNPDAVLLVDTRSPLAALAPDSATATTTSSAIVAANAGRRGLTLTNLSTLVTVSLAFGFPAVANKGIVLSPGAIFHMGEFDFTTSAVNAICSATTAVIAIQEYN